MTIAAAALGVLLTALAVTFAPGDDSSARDIAASPEAREPRSPTVPSAPTTTGSVPSTSLPPGTITVVPPSEPGPAPTAPSTTQTTSPWAEGEAPTERELARLGQRVARHPGLTKKEMADRVHADIDDDLLEITWLLERAEPPDDESEAEPSDDESEAERSDDESEGASAEGSSSEQTPTEARAEQLRRELRRVLRRLATQPLPDEIAIVRLRALDPDEVGVDDDVKRGTEPDEDAVVLDAAFRVPTLEALQSDDVRLEDATLEELLGLAALVSGDERWGITVALLPPYEDDPTSPTSTAPSTSAPSTSSSPSS